MTFPAPVQFDPHSSLLWIYDALHGSIDTLDAYYSEEVGTITRLLRSPVLERLRRVKQLGFASQSYPAADHSRYAHALGTMHVMRKILDRLDSVDGLQQELFTALKTAFPDRFSQPDFENRALLVQHMLIAALLQDIGELPYAQATKLFYRPSESLRNDVRNLVGLDIHLWNDKSIFAIGCLYNNSILNIINDLSIQFLVYLL